MASDYCRQIIILGKTGSGKSSLGNSLLGTDAFEVGHNLKTVTERCQQRSENNICVIDTPGLLDVENHVADRALEILSSLNKCPKPHAFMIVFSALARTGHDELLTIDLLRLIFNENVLNHAIVVFTGYDDKATESDFDKFWRGNVIIRELVEACGGRVARIDNKGATSELSKRVGEILHRVDLLCEQGQKMYDSTYKSVTEHVLQKVQRNSVKLAKKNPNHQPHSIGTFENEVQRIRIALSREYQSRFKSAGWQEKRMLATILLGLGLVAAILFTIRKENALPDAVTCVVSNGGTNVVSSEGTIAVSSEGTSAWMNSTFTAIHVYLTAVVQSAFGSEDNLNRHIEYLNTIFSDM